MFFRPSVVLSYKQWLLLLCPHHSISCKDREAENEQDGCYIDILPALNDGDSHDWTLLPERENVLCGVDVAVVN